MANFWDTLWSSAPWNKKKQTQPTSALSSQGFSSALTNGYSGGGGGGGSGGSVPYTGQPVSYLTQPPQQPQVPTTPTPTPTTTTASTSGGVATTASTAQPDTSMQSVAQQQADLAAAAKAEQDRLNNSRIESLKNQILSDYEAAMVQLGKREQNTQTQFDTTKGIINAEAESGKTSLQSGLEIAMRNLGLQRSEAGNIQTRESQQAQDIASEQKTENYGSQQGALAQIGNAFSNAKQGLANFLGARGIGDSSAASSMGELLYKQSSGDISQALQTAQKNTEAINKALNTNILNINDDYDTNIKRIQNEETNANAYLQDALGKLETARTTEIAKARSLFDQEINTINGLRTQFGKTKDAEIQNSLSESWNNYQNAIFQIDQELGERKLALDQWAMERQASLDDAKEMATFNASLGSGGGSASNLQLIPVGNEFYNYNPDTGQMTKAEGVNAPAEDTTSQYWTVQKTKDEDGNDAMVRVNTITGEIQPVNYSGFPQGQPEENNPWWQFWK